MTAPAPRAPWPIGRVHWLGIATLYRREAKRYLRWWFEFITQPLVSTGLFVLVFHLALGPEGDEGAGEAAFTYLLPGLLMVGLLSLYAMWNGRHLVAETRKFDARELRDALLDAGWELPLPFLVLGGIYSGVLAASEAAAVTALYVLVVATLIKREIGLRKLIDTMSEAMRLVGAILLILGVALALSNWLVDQEVPSRLFEFLQEHVDSPLAFLLLLNLFLLVVGMLLDVFSAVVILVPLLVPVALGYGIDPIHLGIILLANLQLGYFTPPVGMNLFIASYRFDVPVTKLVRSCIPFFLILAFAVLLITYWPALSLALVR